MKRILIVEDEPTVSEFLQLLLASIAQDNVVVSESIRGGLAIIGEEDPFDLLITDYHLPDGTGDTIAKAAKARYWKTKVLMISGGLHLEDEPSVLESVDQFLRKPFNPETEFFPTVKNLLGLRLEG